MNKNVSLYIYFDVLMLSLSHSRRRQRYISFVGLLIGIVFIVTWARSSTEQNSSTTFNDYPHAKHEVVPTPVPAPVAVPVPVPAPVHVPMNIIPAAIVTTSIATATGFPQVRQAVAKRRFTSPAVESLITEIEKNIQNKELAWLFANCFPNTLDTTIDFELKEGSEKKPDTYVITGDIDAMWLRDSSAQVNPYLPLINKDPKLRQLIEGVLLRQCLFIQRDPYANAHYKDIGRTSEWKQMDQTEMRPGVHERKWELDSLCYVIRLMHSYWKEVNQDLTFFRENAVEFKKTIGIILQTMKEQQRFNGSGRVK